MPAEDGSDLVATVAAEIAKQLPVKAATEPGAVQAGALGADLMKCLRLELVPLALARGASSSFLISRVSSRDQVTLPDRDLL